MALQTQVKRINFNSVTGKENRGSSSVTFDNKVRTASVALNGYKISFTNSDHPLREIKINLISLNESSIQGKIVNFAVDFGLRDNTGNYDDAYEGYVDVLVIADTGSIIDDLADSLKGYLDDENNVQLEITDKSQISPSGGGLAININDIWRFKVNIINKGKLDMKNIVLKLDGLNQTQISQSENGPWSRSVDSNILSSITTEDSSKSNFLYFKAPPTPSNNTKLIAAKIKKCELSLNRLINYTINNPTKPLEEFSGSVYTT